MAQSEPFVGTWKLDLAQSKYDPGPRPKGKTRTSKPSGDSWDPERSELFHKIGCATGRAHPLTTAPVGAKINGGTFTILDALAGKSFHLFGDFVVLEVRIDDGIVMAIQEHYGRNWHQIHRKSLSLKSFVSAQNKGGTAPL